MDRELEEWIEEMLEKGTFESREDAIEFCVGATKMFCEAFGYTQESIISARDEIESIGPNEQYPYEHWSFPLKWSKCKDDLKAAREDVIRFRTFKPTTSGTPPEEGVE